MDIGSLQIVSCSTAGPKCFPLLNLASVSYNLTLFVNSAEMYETQNILVPPPLHLPLLHISLPTAKSVEARVVSIRRHLKIQLHQYFNG